MRALPLCSLLLFSLFGCAASTEGPEQAQASESELSQTRETIVRFDRDQVRAEGDLVVGTKAKIVYDAERLTQCRGERLGIHQWTITGYYRINGGEIEMFGAGGLSESNGSAKPIIALTEPGDLEVWFQNTNRWGCSAYDSDYGGNFHFKILPGATSSAAE